MFQRGANEMATTRGAERATQRFARDHDMPQIDPIHPIQNEAHRHHPIRYTALNALKWVGLELGLLRGHGAFAAAPPERASLGNSRLRRKPNEHLRKGTTKLTGRQFETLYKLEDLEI